jgi:Tfp pilus assembly protein PilO
MSSITKYQQQLSSALQNFYQKPVARVSVELLLSIGLVMFLAVFAIRPTLLTMSNLIKEIDDKTVLNNQLATKVAALNTAQAEFLSFEDKLPILDQAISSNPDLVYSLKVLEKLAADNRVIISGMTISELPQEEVSDQPFNTRVLNTMPISINLVGDYISLRNFTEAIRSNRHSYMIESISFDLDQDGETKSLRALLTVSLPYYGAPTGVEDTAAPSTNDELIAE